MVLNLLVVLLYAGAWIVRYGDATATWGYVLTYVGLALLVWSGWYGGHLVYVGLLGTASEPATTVEGRTVETTRSSVVR